MGKIYDLVVVPSTYYETAGTPQECVICAEPIEKVDSFRSKRVDFDYQGDLCMCPTCGQVHYVPDATFDLQGPVSVQWGDL